MNIDKIVKCFPNLEKNLILEIEKIGLLKNYKNKEYIIKQGQFIRHLPIILSGNVKVFSLEDSIQFLLYYIDAGEPCIFSFAHLLNDNPIEFSAVTEQDCELLLLPVKEVKSWLAKYPSFASLLLVSYEKHYKDLLNTTKELICFGLEERLLKYLQTKTEIEKSKDLKVTHQEIADDLGTSREVISRLLKKLSKDGKVMQEGRKIKVLL